MSYGFRLGEATRVASSRAGAVWVACMAVLHLACSNGGFAPEPTEGGDDASEAAEASPVVIVAPSHDASPANIGNVDAQQADGSITTVTTGDASDANAPSSSDSGSEAAVSDAAAPCDGGTLSTDPNNCGACGNVCKTTMSNAVPTCVAGSCGVACAPKFHQCGSDGGTTCADDTSPATCGSSCSPCTGAPANATEACTATDAGAYACGWSCAANLSACGNTCVDLQHDVTNCGTCGNLCAAPLAHSIDACQSGACQTSCATGYHMCTLKTGAECADDTSPDSCGSSCSPCPAPANATATCVASACGFACKTGFSLCGGTCVDLTSDANNCGACGHGCAPGTCASSACQPWTIQPPTSASAPTFVGSDGSYVVWADQGTNNCAIAPAATGPIQTFATEGVPWGAAMAPNLAACLVSSGSDIHLWTMVANGSVPTSQVATVTGMWAGTAYGLTMTPSGTSAFFDDQLTGAVLTQSVMQCDLGPTVTCNKIFNFMSNSTGKFAANDNNIFVAEGGNGSIEEQSLSLAGSMTVAINQGTVLSAALDTSTVFWCGLGSGVSLINSAPVGGGSVSPVVSGIPGAIANLGTDGVLVYFAVQASADSYIASVPVGGGTPKTLYTSASNVLIPDMVYAGGAVYWAEFTSARGNGAVYGLRVP